MKAIRNWFYGLCLLCMAGLCFGCGKESVKEELKTAGEISAESSADSSFASLTAESLSPSSADASRETDSSDTSGENGSVSSVILVDVCGAVEKPGVYTLCENARLYEAIEMAGGFAAGADMTYHNRARQLSDGEQIYVPTTEEVENGKVPSGAAAQTTKTGSNVSGDGRININTATSEELQTLSGIGEKKAESIISYREENGAFASPEDLMQVEGIKEGTFQKIKDKITTN